LAKRDGEPIFIEFFLLQQFPNSQKNTAIKWSVCFVSHQLIHDFICFFFFSFTVSPHTQTDKDSKSILISLLTASSEFKLRQKLHKEAISDLENLLKLQPRELPTIAKLVLAYAKHDPSGVAKFESMLPPSAAEGVDATELERLPPPRVTRWEKMADKQRYLFVCLFVA
jgi:hypothetical protein